MGTRFKRFMGSRNIDSLFTNIPLEENINICTNLLFDNEDIIERIKRSPLGHNIANAFLSFHEFAWLKQCPKEFKGGLSGLRQFLATESPLRMMKNAFYLTSKALFFLKIFNFLS